MEADEVLIDDDIVVMHKRSTDHRMERPHFHDGMEIHFTLSDQVTYYVDERKYVGRTGSVAVFAPDELHRVVVEENAFYERYYLHFKPQCLDFTLSECPNILDFFTTRSENIGNVVLLSPDSQRQLMSLFDAILAAQKEEGSTAELLVKIRLLDALLFLRKQFHDPLVSNTQLSHRRDDDTKKIMRYMKDNYSHQLRLDEICSLFYISKSTLIRLFRENIGLTPMEYLNKIRVLESRKLLQEGYSVQEVARAVGYKDAVTFIRNFKRVHGVPPKQYALEIAKRRKQSKLRKS